MPNQPSQVYRASVAALMVNDKNEILMVQNTSFREDEWDFPKGGMNLRETPEETIQRELQEELGEDLQFSFIKKSNWNVIYEWPLLKQQKEGMRGQARISYWLRYEGGAITLDPEEVQKYIWVKPEDLEMTLKQSGWPEDIYRVLLWEMEQIVNASNV